MRYRVLDDTVWEREAMNEMGVEAKEEREEKRKDRVKEVREGETQGSTS